ncbi:MAG: alpha/beta hydrolase, partial [Acetobacteraceae bacterium]|nr:alpha/beta hydrolase [Acetobacteraceae bacterium]
MLRQEPLDSELGLVNAGQQLRILYSSTNGIDGTTPVAVSGAVFLPEGRPPAGGWPIIAWAHGTTGVADVCAPSWRARYFYEAAHLAAWLTAGYAVVATDYQGLGTPGPHPYLAMRPEAYSVL